jgi:membrane-associated phospholipid phosphatase
MKASARVFLALAGLLLSVHPVDAASTTEKAGDVLALVLPAAAYGTTYYKGDKTGSRQFEKSFLGSVGLTYGLKAIIDHHGPNGKSHAFPSGHSTLAFSGAAFLQRRYGWRPALPAWLAAIFVGYSRIQSDNHDFAEVATGAGISIASAWYFVTPYEEKTAILPYLQQGGGGIAFIGRW